MNGEGFKVLAEDAIVNLKHDIDTDNAAWFEMRSCSRIIKTLLTVNAQGSFERFEA